MIIFNLEMFRTNKEHLRKGYYNSELKSKLLRKEYSFKIKINFQVLNKKWSQSVLTIKISASTYKSDEMAISTLELEVYNRTMIFRLEYCDATTWSNGQFFGFSGVSPSISKSLWVVQTRKDDSWKT